MRTQHAPSEALNSAVHEADKALRSTVRCVTPLNSMLHRPFWQLRRNSSHYRYSCHDQLYGLRP